MYVARLAAAAVLCGLAALFAAFGQQWAMAADAGQLPLPASKYELAWPKSQSPTEAEPAKAWPTQEVELARARCAVLLKGLHVVAIPEAPMREGVDCGAPAPMKLISIGKAPQIAFSPPPTLTCDMIAALHKWLEQDVQALARKHLGAPLVRIATMSSYSCRNAYGRTKTRLSEHGRMNAIDIGAFVTAGGKTAMVLTDWGPNAREITAKAVEAQKKQQPLAAEAADAKKAAEAPPRTIPAPPVSLRPSIAAGVGALPGIVLQTPAPPPAALGLTEPARLGGPKPGAPAATATPAAISNTGLFLRAVHQAACRTFGTVLGPEANSFHNNHFHLDMADRKLKAICE
jgi:hypothetical protein